MRSKAEREEENAHLGEDFMHPKMTGKKRFIRPLGTFSTNNVHSQVSADYYDISIHFFSHWSRGNGEI